MAAIFSYVIVYRNYSSSGSILAAHWKTINFKFKTRPQNATSLRIRYIEQTAPRRLVPRRIVCVGTRIIVPFVSFVIFITAALSSSITMFHPCDYTLLKLSSRWLVGIPNLINQRESRSKLREHLHPVSFLALRENFHPTLLKWRFCILYQTIDLLKRFF